jgi:hypothetical protein
MVNGNVIWENKFVILNLIHDNINVVVMQNVVVVVGQIMVFSACNATFLIHTT